jgi:hypothetical protein
LTQRTTSGSGMWSGRLSTWTRGKNDNKNSNE